MPNDRFDALLSKLPEIAKAVNEFKSESVQQRAFDALLKSLAPDLGSAAHHDERTGSASPHGVIEEVDPPTVAKKSGSGRKSTGKKSVDLEIVHDLNLRPAGKQSLREFYAEKKPATNEQTYAVVIYYLQHTLGQNPITVHHVYTALKDIPGFRVPGRLRTILSNTSSDRGWFDAADKDKIRMTVPGDNVVEHDLPPKAKK